MKIGILGGTFDPPHNGHMALAEAAKAALQLDEILWVPAYNNPLKNKRQGTPARHRLEMVKLATSDHPGMAVSDVEVIRRGQSYTVDTVSELQFVRPAEYWVIMGADALIDLTKWKQPERLLRMCRIAAVVRPPATVVEALLRMPPEFRERIDIIEMKPMDLSSTDIREKVGRGHAINLWVTKGVMKYIEENKLYKY
jgi:nicotinate-nucleotide adenylyltransferase